MKRTSGLSVSNIIGIIFLFVGTIIIFSACSKKKEYYERPDWLEPAIYNQLEEKGNFSHYLALVDKAGFKRTLSSSGYFTVFAPTDEAVERYLQQNGYASVNDIDTTTAQGIVQYSIAYNAYFLDEIDDYQNASLDTAQRYDEAFRRRTMYYKWVFEENVNGQDIRVIDQNGVLELPEQGPYFNATDNNNKYIPYFTRNFFLNKGLSDYDYNYFYPEKDFSGFNIANANTVEYDLRAENGVIHTVDEVIPPLPNIEDLLADNPDYSVFYDLVKKYMLEYDLAPEAFLNRFAQYNGAAENVYVKQYNLMNFAPNCENYMRYATGNEHDAQRESWTMFAPNNAATNTFINQRLLKYYPSIDVLSNELIAEFINAHLFRAAVWPSKFESTVNYYGEPARFDPESNVVEKKIGSNGMFYGTNTIQRTDAFYTVLGEIILNPEYALMLAALRATNIYDVLKNPDLTMTVFLLDNESFTDLGLEYESATNSWNLTNPALGSNATLALNRIIKMSIILGEAWENFGGDGIIQTYGGEYIRFQGGSVYGAGNFENGEIVVPYKPDAQGTNGITWLVNQPLYYTTKEIGSVIKLNQSNYGEFFRYLDKCGRSLPGFIYDPATESITSIKAEEPNTLLIPTDSAMQRAVLDGYLPVITDVNFNQAQLEKVGRFINYHCLNGQIIVPGSGFSGPARTLYQTDDGTVSVEVEARENDLVITDDYNRDVHIIYEKSNILSNNAVIHLLDDYLKYTIE